MDDDQDFGEYLRSIAQAENFDVLLISDAADFQNQYRSFKPDMIILDLGIPQIDGIELLRLLKTENCLCPIAIMSGLEEKIILSAHRIGRLHGLNMLSAFKKPVQAQTIVALLHQVNKLPQLKAEQLAKAIEEKKLILHYQPKISLRDKDLIGAEALVRLQNEDSQLIMPDNFIPLAEDCGLIKQLTLFVFEKAIQECVTYYKSHPRFITAINLSAKLLVDLQLPDELEHIARRYNVEPQSICLEITETAAMSQPLQAIDILARFRLKKFLLAVDDFGTGFSSLAVLHRMPFNELKIDKIFIKDLPEDNEIAVMVQEMISLGKNCGYKITAEGVENLSTLEALKQLNCDIAQGYYIGRPMSFVHFKTWQESISEHAWKKLAT